MATPVDKFEQAFERHKAGRLVDAVRLYREAIQANPRHAQAWHQLGCIFQSQRQLEQARECLSRAILLDGGQAEYHNNLGDCLRADGRLADARASFEQACRLKADYVAPRVNLSLTLLGLGRAAEAESAAQQALQLARTTPEEHCAAATLRLLHGDFTAWEEHEWRLQIPGLPRPRLPGVKWEGQPLEGRSILLYAEQGLGDILQFVRYAPLVRGVAGETVLSVPGELIPLLRESALGNLVPSDEAPPECDFHCALMSLPYVLRTTLDAVPGEVPYLRASERLAAEWKERLAPIEGFRVGIHWQGSPRFPFDRVRSIPLAKFEPLARVPGVRLLSLQTQSGVEQLDAFAEQCAVVDLGEPLVAEPGTFMDKAAVMRNLDLVVTSDTSTAHLAGALGVKVWVALQMVPDWRWLLARDDSPWYPTMRLFRQRAAGDWDEVFSRMTTELARAVAGGRRD